MSRPPSSLKPLPLAAGLLLALGGRQAAAQCPDSGAPAGASGAIVGTITDTLGMPLDSIDILIPSLRRRTMSSDGAFWFNDVKPGRYDLSARRIGYLPQVQTVTVGPNGGVARFCLIPLVRGLPALVSSAARGGLSGVIGDTAFAIVRGAEIFVLAAGQRAVSDSTGAFYVPLRPGKYVVRVSRSGFRNQMVSVTVPGDSGRKVAVWLVPAARGASKVEQVNTQELTERLRDRVPARSAIYTREDIIRSGAVDLVQIARLGATAAVDDGCQAFIDGGPRTRALWELRAADIEMIEVYIPKGTRTSTTVRGTARINQNASSGASCPVTVYVWLRK